jgi:hypothetical protein
VAFRRAQQNGDLVEGHALGDGEVNGAGDLYALRASPEVTVASVVSSR